LGSFRNYQGEKNGETNLGKTQAFKWIQRAERLAEKVEEAFAGEPFSRKWRAEDPRNVKRFNLYIKLLMKAFDLEVKAIRFWMQTQRIDPCNPSQWGSQTDEQAGATPVPAGYKVVGFTPTQTLLQREEVTPEHVRMKPQSVTKPVENAAKIRKPR
jgi:hypothetical protein